MMDSIIKNVQGLYIEAFQKNVGFVLGVVF